LWALVKHVLAPAMEHLINQKRHLTYPEKVVFAEALDLVDRLLTKIDGHSLLEAMIAEQ
jgi:hypothetical protein